MHCKEGDIGGNYDTPTSSSYSSPDEGSSEAAAAIKKSRTELIVAAKKQICHAGITDDYCRLPTHISAHLEDYIPTRPQRFRSDGRRAMPDKYVRPSPMESCIMAMVARSRTRSGVLQNDDVNGSCVKGMGRTQERQLNRQKRQQHERRL